MRKAFTLIELMVSIMILSMLMLFLYKSYSELNKSNRVYEKEVQNIKSIELLKKTIYLDFSLATPNLTKILNQSKTEDIVFLQSRHSLHDRINPFVAYIVKEKRLYRLESLKELKEYPLAADSEFEVDYLGEIKIFRTYKDKSVDKELYLAHIEFKEKSEIILKVKVLGS